MSQTDTKDFIDFLCEPEDLLALVVLNGVRPDGRSMGRTALGLYKNRRRFCDDVEQISGCGDIYMNLNALNPDVYGRAADHLKLFSPSRFSNSEITRRRALLVDCDPHRLSGINSTDDELQNSIGRSQEIVTYLRDLWAVEALSIRSGNGAQLLYRIDEPSDTDLVLQVLKHLDSKFSDNVVKVDTSVSDASRITRLPGTLNCKGDDIPDRPRRMSTILSLPSEKRVVTTEQLKMLVNCYSDNVDRSGDSEVAIGKKGDWNHDRLKHLLNTSYKQFNGKGWDYLIEDNPTYGTMYKIKQCPFVEHRVEYRAALWINNGVLCYKCFSDECDGDNKRTGGDFVKLVNPEPPLAVTDELRLARHVCQKFSQAGTCTLAYFQHAWYRWDGSWRAVDEEQLSSTLYQVCKDNIMSCSPKNDIDRFGNPKTAPKLGKSQLSNVILALKSLVTISQVGWRNGDGGRWLAFQDQLLDLNAWIDGSVVCVDQTPKYFSPSAIPYPLIYTEQEPTIFLEKLRDQVTENEVAALQEFGGYCLTEDTSFQRILCLVGPPRSFKGTYEKCLRHSVGEHNTVAKTLKSFLSPHALENVPGKTFLGISDSRPDPNLSRSAVERLLSISGEDPQDINPKGKPPYTAKLNCKIAVIANLIPDFADPTGAMLSRFIFIETTKSYAENPDSTLLDRILTQQNELTWWFLCGLRRLLQNGAYTATANTLGAKFQRKNNPIPCFVQSKCRVTGNSEDKLSRDTLYEAFETWCAENQVQPLDKNIFCRDLYATFPIVKGKERYISGIVLAA